MKKGFSLLSVFLVLFSCNETQQVKPSEGMWLAELAVTDNEVLPFNFKLSKDTSGDLQMQLYNAEEVIQIDEIEIHGDSIRIQAPVFEGYISGVFNETTITGDFIKESLDRVVPFKARFGEEERFPNSENATANISGIWEVEFVEDDGSSYPAKGIFKQDNNTVTGTFRTNTGDYRYLDGVMDGDSLKVSAFDGAHAFLFTAKVSDSTMAGSFYSGNHYKAILDGKRNEHFELANSDSLTFLKEGYEKLAFSFPDADGNIVSLKDKRFQNKVVLVQIMGTWCPNCLDESKYYVDYIKKNPNSDFEIVALAFEYAKTKEGAFKGIARLKERLGISYPILLAQMGTEDKKLAQQKLPMLNHVLSYPTSIFIDKKGAVRKIHTGFNGPATGEKFIEFKQEFESFVSELVAE